MLPSSSRIVKAFLLAPLAAPLTYAVLTLPFGPLTLARLQLGLFDIFTFGLVLSYVGAIVIGVPILVVLKRFQMTRYSWFALFGSLIGLLVIYLLMSEVGGGPLVLGQFLAIGAICGLLSASLFWQLAFREQIAPSKQNDSEPGSGNRTEPLPA